MAIRFCNTRNQQDFLTFVLLVDLKIDCVNAFLNIIPCKKLLLQGKCLHSLLDKSVSIPEGQEIQPSFTTFKELLLINLSWC